MSNFRLLGNALIDFSRVLYVEAAEENLDGPGFAVKFTDGTAEYFYFKNPAATLSRFHEQTTADDDKRAGAPLEPAENHTESQEGVIS